MINPHAYPPAAEAFGIQSATLQVFPNPANSEVRFHFKDLTRKEVEYQLIIYDLWGRAVHRDAFSGGSYQLRWDCSGMVKGMYLYRVIDPSGTHFSGSVIVQ